jgi:hypothetical protein
MKILCHINHFFGINKDFLGKSSLKTGISQEEYTTIAQIRKENVEKSISQIKNLKYNITVKVCGIQSHSLVNIDKELNNCISNPLNIIYESICSMESEISKYDYFINMEDDIFLPEETFENIVQFDKYALINEVLLPNRLERTNDDNVYCVDLKVLSGWTHQRKTFNGNRLRVALNPHSAILILRKDKFIYSLNNIDKSFRGKLLYNELDSAFAHFHSPFSLYRSENIDFHYIYHLDNWIPNAENKRFLLNELKNIKFKDFIPPIIIKFYNYIISIIS